MGDIEFDIQDHVKELDPSKHKKQCIEVWSNLMGEEWSSEERILQACRQKGKAFVVEKEGKVYGFCIGIVDIAGNITYCRDSILEEVSIEEDEIIKYYDTICIRKEFQRNGIGSVLTNRILTEMREMQPSRPIVAEPWIKDQDVDGADVLGDEFVTEIQCKNYWNDENDCKICDGPCECSGSMAVDFDGTGEDETSDKESNSNDSSLENNNFI